MNKGESRSGSPQVAHFKLVNVSGHPRMVFVFNVHFSCRQPDSVFQILKRSHPVMSFVPYCVHDKMLEWCVLKSADCGLLGGYRVLVK